ncbi:hypothetical protein CBR_g5582 [Chara braunii]|uniref:RNA-binding protein Tab2/Atab2 C-terminal domain-containing protein n=1 Tax=Chara braunii TaxID=69332 RepID=A0A388JRI6_CHABU|nr:hypothetical protein CBR_g5582 [Chara braunii]|eukprot:GBG60405.1 hypothetical protein CBR_g5582 [Chara braunii]
MLDPPMPQDLPDTLRGEQWAFVQLPLEVLETEIMAVERGQVFGDVYDLDILGIDLSPDTMIPGVAVASRRATALAAYTSALELASIKVDPKMACLLLQTNVLDRWRYAFYRKSRQADEEARAWEDAKAQCKGLHFLAVQSDFESDDCAGFWLLLDTEPPQI